MGLPEEDHCRYVGQQDKYLEAECMPDIFREQQGRTIVAGLEVRESRRPDNVGPLRVIVRTDNLSACVGSRLAR